MTISVEAGQPNFNRNINSDHGWQPGRSDSSEWLPTELSRRGRVKKKKTAEKNKISQRQVIIKTTRGVGLFVSDGRNERSDDAIFRLVSGEKSNARSDVRAGTRHLSVLAGNVDR